MAYPKLPNLQLEVIFGKLFGFSLTSIWPLCIECHQSETRAITHEDRSRVGSSFGAPKKAVGSPTVSIPLEGPPIELSTSYANAALAIPNVESFMFVWSNQLPSRPTFTPEHTHHLTSPESRYLIRGCCCAPTNRYFLDSFKNNVDSSRYDFLVLFEIWWKFLNFRRRLNFGPSSSPWWP